MWYMQLVFSSDTGAFEEAATDADSIVDSLAIDEAFCCLRLRRLSLVGLLGER